MGNRLIGLVPAGGCGSRIGRLPCSKELLPLGMFAPDGTARPKPVCLNLLMGYQAAGIEEVCFALRDGKWDIPAYFRGGQEFGLAVSYVVARETWGVPFTIDAAWPVTRDHTVAFGFPDIVFRPPEVYARLLERFRESVADVGLAALPVAPGQPADMLQLDDRGRLEAIVVKPERTHLTQAWVAAVWGPAFTAYLHDFCEEERRERAGDGGPREEIQLSKVLMAAQAAGLRLHVESVPDGWWLDVGTPAGLQEASRLFAADGA